MLGLQGYGDRSVTQLSGGQRQRVALGRALAIDPQILLLDEPLSNLDARIRLQMRHEIRSIQRQLGVTAILVTHDREEAMVMADQVVILDQGKVAQVGTPEQVYQQPATPYVAAFMGAENIIECEATPAGRRQRAAHRRAAASALVHCQRHAGPVQVHFRSERASLQAPDAAPRRQPAHAGHGDAGQLPRRQLPLQRRHPLRSRFSSTTLHRWPAATTSRSACRRTHCMSIPETRNVPPTPVH